MNISSINPNASVPDVPIESLAGNQRLSKEQKIAVASRQFEAMLLKQVLAETQKPVFKTSFTDNSTAAGIYRDMISGQLADSLSKTDAIGLAKTFARQLNRQADAENSAANNGNTLTTPPPAKF